MRKTVFHALALAGVCLFSLFVSEVVLRVSNVWVGRHSDTMFSIIEYDTVLGWKLKPGIHEKINLVDVENLPVRSNSQGFRDKEFNLDNPLRRYRIAFLGDSFTWGMGVGEEGRFTNLVARNSAWETLNFGVPGYGTDQTLLLWQHIAQRYKPDLVVLTIYQNDYLDNMYLVRYGRQKPYFQLREGSNLEVKNLPVNPIDFWGNGIYNQVAPVYAALFQKAVQKRSRVLHWLAKHSDLARFVYTVFRSPGQQTESTTKTIGSSKLTSLQQMQVALLSALVKELAKEVRAQGASFMVVLAGEPIPQYDLQKKIFADSGIFYLDATTVALTQRLDNSRQRLYYPYSRHWTLAAHRAVAELIREGMREHGLSFRYSR